MSYFFPPVMARISVIAAVMPPPPAQYRFRSPTALFGHGAELDPVSADEEERAGYRNTRPCISGAT